MNNDRLTYLFQRYLDGQCSPDENAELLQMFRQPDMKEPLKELLDKAIAEADETEVQHVMNKDVAQSIYHSIIEVDKQANTEKKSTPLITMRVRRWLVAASVLAILLIGSYLFFNKQQDKKELATHNSVDIQEKDVLPGKDNAMLTMSDGSQIILENAANGNLAIRQSVKIIKQDGQIMYQPGDAAKSAIVEYNTITTPRGGQYRLILSDGSKVWLNAASSLRFPTAFMGDKREVTLTGEGYFEVAKNAVKPFHVQADNMNVQVLGTHFNVNAYVDEGSTKTTLLEGKVKVSSLNMVQLLMPGQQAFLLDGKMKIVPDINVEEVIAWKNGLFQLNSVDVAAIMKQIARWYDVEVEYEGKIPEAHITGKMSRDLNLSQVLKILEHSGLRCKAMGRKIIVLSEG